jgi:hypothetical protein
VGTDAARERPKTATYACDPVRPRVLSASAVVDEKGQTGARRPNLIGRGNASHRLAWQPICIGSGVVGLGSWRGQLRDGAGNG